jgi:thiol:disulfide interchange protein
MAQPVLRRLLLCAAITALVAAHASAQLPGLGKSRLLGGRLGGNLGGSDSKVSLKAEFTEPAGDSPALLFITAKIVPDFHVYAIDQVKTADGDGPKPTTLSIAEGQPVKLLGPFKAIQPPATHIDQKVWPGLQLREHTDEVTWYAPVELADSVSPAAFALKGFLNGQACDESSCVPLNLEFTAHVGPGMPIPPPTMAEPMAASHGSLLTVALYGLLGGLILNLMPCVLPVIGLKVLSFAEQGGRARRKVFTLNLAYVAGLLSVFLVLATLAASVQLGIADKDLGWGELNTKLPFKVAMAGLVFAMALSFLGVWEIPIPGFASSHHAMELSRQEGPFGAFCMGVFTTLLATPCSGPFLGPVLGYTISQPASITYLVFTSIGLGMGLPYLLIGIFPSLVSWLPKPGQWMETLKHLLGFVLLATVVWLFSSLNSDYFIPTLAMLFGIWFACWLIGYVPEYAPLGNRLAAWAGGISVATVIGWLSFAALAPSASPLPWQPYSPQALAIARAQGKTVLVDFTANWCLTCKTNLKFSLDRPDVKELVEKNGVIALKADWTDENPTIKQALAELNSRSIPLLAIYPADVNRDVIVLPDLLTPGKVLDALSDAGPSLDQPAAAIANETTAAPFEQVDATAPEAPEFGAMPADTAVR